MTDNIINIQTTPDVVIDIDKPVYTIEISQGARGKSSTLTIGTVTTLDAGEDATVENVGTTSDSILNFGIPKGFDGEVTEEELTEGLALKVDKVTGKGLSTNDFTDVYESLLTSFNGASQLVQMTSATKLPAVDGSLLTGLQTYQTSNMDNAPILSNNTTDANNDIDFSSGFCWDSSLTTKIVSSAMIKRLDAIFAEGTNQGGLDTGTKSVSTWYHCFAISKADGTSDFLFSTSLATPTMPSGFVNKRRVGSIKTDSSGNIYGFKFNKNDNSFRWSSTKVDLNTTSTVSTFTDLVLSALPNTVAIVRSTIASNAGTLYLKSKRTGYETTLVAGSTLGNYWTYASDNIDVASDSKIQYKTNGSNTAIWTIGYIDSRGIN